MKIKSILITALTILALAQSAKAEATPPCRKAIAFHLVASTVEKQRVADHDWAINQVVTLGNRAIDQLCINGTDDAVKDFDKKELQKALKLVDKYYIFFVESWKKEL